MRNRRGVGHRPTVYLRHCFESRHIDELTKTSRSSLLERKRGRDGAHHAHDI